MADSKVYRTYSFEKLDVWQLSRELKFEIYRISSHFPDDEKYGLVNQLRRSVSSITANIAEGAGRATDKDKAYFTNIAYASGLESLDHIITALDLGYLSEDSYSDLRCQIDVILGKLVNLYKHHLKRGQNLKQNL